MNEWHPVTSRPEPGTHVWIKGLLTTGAPAEPFKCEARWDGAIWLSINPGWFPPEAFQVTGWKAFDPNTDEISNWHVAGLPETEGSPPPRAFFTWQSDNQFGRSRREDYSQRELEVEIKRRETAQEFVPVEFSEALAWMREAKN
jgi:hypothetical protein